MVKRSVKRGPERIPDYEPPPVIYYNPEQVMSVEVTDSYVFLAPTKCLLSSFVAVGSEEALTSLLFSSSTDSDPEHVILGTHFLDKGNFISLFKGDTLTVQVNGTVTLAFTIRTTHDAPEDIFQRITDKRDTE